MTNTRHYFEERSCICGRRIVGRLGCANVPCQCGTEHDFSAELSDEMLMAAVPAENSRRMVIPVGVRRAIPPTVWPLNQVFGR